MIDLKNLKGFVFYVDMLGFTALTQDKIQLTKDDFNIWQVSKYFQTLGNQEFAANILILFRKILTDCQNKYPKVNSTQLSDCAFVWSERGCVKMMHPLFRYRTIGFSFFIEYDLFFPVSMLSGGIICCRRWLIPPLYFDNFCLSSSHS